MTEFIPIKQTREDLLQQFDYIKQIENFNYRREFGGVFIGVVLMSIVVFVLYLFTPSDELIKLKGVLSVLSGIAWLVVISVIGWRLIKRQRIHHSMRKAIDSHITSGKEYYMFFDDDGLTHGSIDHKTELKWSYFFAYLESPSIILLFSNESFYSYTGFSASEIGADNLEKLKVIVRGKLPLLNENIHLKERTR